MKKLFLALALVAYIGSTSAITVVSSENSVCMHEEKGKKDKKKKKKDCHKAAEGTATEGKSCSKTTEGKSCCAKKAGAKATVAPADKAVE